MNPPALLDAPAGRTASGAVEYDYQAGEPTTSAIIEVVERHGVAARAFTPVPPDEYRAAPIEGEIGYDEPAERLRSAQPVDEAESASAFPGSPFGV